METLGMINAKNVAVITAHFDKLYSVVDAFGLTLNRISAQDSNPNFFQAIF